MRKTLALLLALMMLLSLAACGDPAAKAADDLISAIGTVTLDSEPAIQAAEAAVSALPEASVSKLSNAQLLSDARAAYDALVAAKAEEERVQALAKELEALIAPLDREVSLDDWEEVFNVRTKYDSSEAAVQAAVSNLDVLTAAEKTIRDIKVNALESMINDIGEVTLKSQKAINDVEVALGALTDAEKDLVSNLSVYEEAKTALADLIAKEGERLKGTLRVEDTNFFGTKLYYSQKHPKYVNSRTYMLPYIGENSDGSSYLCLDINYYGRSWIYYKTVIIEVDGKSYNKFYVNSGDVNRQVAGGNVTEDVRDTATEEDIEMLRNIAVSENATVTFGGSQWIKHTISDSDKAAIRDILTVYDYMQKS